MTSIQLRTESIDIPVTFTSEQLHSLFDQSLTELIDGRVAQAIVDQAPDTLAITDSLCANTRFNRNMREALMEHIDYHEIRTTVLDSLSYSEIVAHIEDSSPMYTNDNLVRGLTRSSRFQTLVRESVRGILNTTDINEKIDAIVQARTANLANEIAEKVLAIIGNRLAGGIDV
jgi:hypothetical protein